MLWLHTTRSTAYSGQWLLTRTALSLAGSFASHQILSSVLLSHCSVPACFISPKRNKVCFFFNLTHTAFGKHQKALHLASFELRFHAAHVAKGQKLVVTASQKVLHVSLLITKISDHTSAILIIRSHKITDPPKSVG